MMSFLYFSGTVKDFVIESIPHDQFISLATALYDTIIELDRNGRCPSRDSIIKYLKNVYHNVRIPTEDVIHKCLGKLIEQRKIYHDGVGYRALIDDSPLHKLKEIKMRSAVSAETELTDCDKTKITPKTSNKGRSDTESFGQSSNEVVVGTEMKVKRTTANKGRSDTESFGKTSVEASEGKQTKITPDMAKKKRRKSESSGKNPLEMAEGTQKKLTPKTSNEGRNDAESFGHSSNSSKERKQKSTRHVNLSDSSSKDETTSKTQSDEDKHRFHLPFLELFANNNNNTQSIQLKVTKGKSSSKKKKASLLGNSALFEDDTGDREIKIIDISENMSVLKRSDKLSPKDLKKIVMPFAIHANGDNSGRPYDNHKADLKSRRPKVHRSRSFTEPSKQKHRSRPTRGPDKKADFPLRRVIGTDELSTLSTDCDIETENNKKNKRGKKEGKKRKDRVEEQVNKRKNDQRRETINVANEIEREEERNKREKEERCTQENTVNEKEVTKRNNQSLYVDCNKENQQKTSDSNELKFELQKNLTVPSTRTSGQENEFCAADSSLTESSTTESVIGESNILESCNTESAINVSSKIKSVINESRIVESTIDEHVFESPADISKEASRLTLNSHDRLSSRHTDQQTDGIKETDLISPENVGLTYICLTGKRESSEKISNICQRDDSEETDSSERHFEDDSIFDYVDSDDDDYGYRCEDDIGIYTIEGDLFQTGWRV